MKRQGSIRRKSAKRNAARPGSSNKNENITYIEPPKLQFSIDDESYYLWVRDNEGLIMNTKDTFTLYTLSEQSVNEIKEINK